MDKNITFSSDVILLDVAFLREITISKHFLGDRLQRELPDTDLVKWLVCLALDAGLRGAEHEVQVLLVADGLTQALDGFLPASLEELDGKACQTALGEFSFSVVPSAGMVSRAELFEDLTKLALDAQEVECLVLVPHFYEYGEKLAKAFQAFCEATKVGRIDKALCFLMERPDSDLLCSWDLATYSLMHIWGISPADL